MSLHRKWSKKVHLPVGTEWGQPYNSSVAQCMVWPSASGSIPDPYQDSLGKPKGAVPQSKLSVLRNTYDRRRQEVRLENDFDQHATSRLSGELKARPPTPMKTKQTENYADKFSSYYVENGPDGPNYCLTPQQETGRGSRLDTNRSVTSQIRARSVGPCESYRDTDRYADQIDDAELIASFLDARDSVTYEKAKREIYDRTYQKQLEEERKRLYLERQREYDEHVRAHSGKLGIDDKALDEAIKKQVRSCRSANPSTRVTARPPLPRRPAGLKSEHRSDFTDPQSRSRKVVYEPGVVENLRVTAGNRNDTIHDRHRAALSRTLLHTPEAEVHRKPVKRVNFRCASASDIHNAHRSRKGGHFFVWRNATGDPTLKDDLWKMQKYQNVKSRVDNRWTSDPYAYKKKDDGRVDIKLECPPGEEMNVNLRVEATPSRNGFIF